MRTAIEKLKIRVKGLEAECTRLEKRCREVGSFTDEIISYMTEGLVLTDTRGTILFVNQRLSDMLGYPPDEIVGKFWLDMVPADQRPIAQVAEDRRARGHTDRYEILLHRKNGHHFPVLIGAGPRFDKKSGTFIGTMGVVTEITERRQAEEEKKTLQAALLQARKMESVGRLAGGVAHDFNNKLGVILGHVAFALEKVEETHTVHSDLQEIQKAAEHSANLTKQLLAFARKQPISPKRLDLNATVGSMLNMLRRLIGESIDLVWQPGSHQWPVMMDPTQVDQVLANLCVNARDAIAGVGRITIETCGQTLDDTYCSEHPGAVPGDYVQLSVSDTGCGMGKEIRDNLFEPFFTTKDVGKGTGLGLATIYGIVKQNNGFIDVCSDSGKGATFKIYLPRLDVETDIATTRGPVKKTFGIGTETILLVEDDPGILDMTRIMLDRFGYTVISAASPTEALEKVTSYTGPVHLLLTDVILPEMDGRDLAEKITSVYPGIRRLFMSGYSSNVIAHGDAMNDRAVFVQKPFSMTDLAAKLREALA